jgi:hypothetical protein
MSHGEAMPELMYYLLLDEARRQIQNHMVARFLCQTTVEDIVIHTYRDDRITD